MITAKEANTLSKMKEDKNVASLLKLVERKISDSIEEGEFKVSIELYLESSYIVTEVGDILSNLGYEIYDRLDEDGDRVMDISWSLE